MTTRISRRRAVAYRLRVNHLTARLPAGRYDEAARYGLQDSGPRDALVALHARVRDCEPAAWQDHRLVQTYSPRAAVYLLPVADLGVFTVGRLPLSPAARRDLEEKADAICRSLAGREVRGGRPGLREACATGRLALRWTTSALYVREVPRPRIDTDEARLELCRRHLRACGPTTPAAFAWWSGLSDADARVVWRRLASQLHEVDLEGHRAWLLAADRPALLGAEPPRGVRLLPPADVRLLGQDRSGLFVGPGMPRHPGHDSFHPGGLLVDGELVGAWGRRGGRVHVVTAEPLAEAHRAAVEIEGAAMPIPGTSAVRVEFAPAVPGTAVQMRTAH